MIGFYAPRVNLAANLQSSGLFSGSGGGVNAGPMWLYESNYTNPGYFYREGFMGLKDRPGADLLVRNWYTSIPWSIRTAMSDATVGWGPFDSRFDPDVDYPAPVFDPDSGNKNAVNTLALEKSGIDLMLLTALGVDDLGDISTPRTMSMVGDFNTMLEKALLEGYGSASAELFPDSDYDLTSAVNTVASGALTHTKNALMSGTEGSVYNASSGVATILGSIEARARAAATLDAAQMDASAGADVGGRSVQAGSSAVLASSEVLGDALTELKADPSSVLSEAKGDADVDVPAIFESLIEDLTAGTYNLGSMVSAAVTAAANAVAVGGVINTIVDAFEEDSRDAYMRGVNQDAGRYADIGASNSSAFFVSMAIRDNQRQREINKFRADLQMEIYKTVLPEYIRAFNQAMTKYLDIYENRLQMHMQMYSGLVAEYGRVYISRYVEYLRAYTTLAGAYISDVTAEKGIGGGIASGIHSNHVSAYEAEITSHLNNYAQALLHRRGARDRFTLEAQNLMAKMEAMRLSMFSTAISNYNDHYKFLYAAGLQEEVKRKEYEVRNNMWNLQVWQGGANILATTTGGVTVTPYVPSEALQFATALLGAGSNMGAAALMAL